MNGKPVPCIKCGRLPSLRTVVMDDGSVAYTYACLYCGRRPAIYSPTATRARTQWKKMNDLKVVGYERDRDAALPETCE